jgi:hypothetical protein
MKKWIFIVFVVVVNVNSYGQGQNQLSLQDTTWKYVGNDDDKYIGHIAFKINGQALFIDQYGTISTGTWVQENDYIRFYITVYQSFAVIVPSYIYMGKITDENNIEGTAFYGINSSNFESWDFRMERVDI